MAAMQSNDLVQFVESAIDAAPVLAISLFVSVGGIFLISRLFLNSWSKSEDKRAITMDTRHKEYFEMMQRMNNATCQAMDRGTQAIKESIDAQKETAVVLSSMQEILRRMQ